MLSKRVVSIDSASPRTCLSDSDFLMDPSHAQPAVGDGNAMQKEVFLVRLLHGDWRSLPFFLEALRGFAHWNPEGFAVTVSPSIFPRVPNAPTALQDAPSHRSPASGPSSTRASATSEAALGWATRVER